MTTQNNHKTFYKIYLRTLITNIRKKGFTWFVSRLLYRAYKEIAWLAMLPISILLHVIGFRRLPIRIEHIGHLTVEFDTFLKAKQLGLLPKKFYFALASQSKVSNPHLLNYWRPYVAIISNPLACHILEIWTWRYFMCDPNPIYVYQFFGTQDIYQINTKWGQRPPLLTLSDDDQKWSDSEFKKLGIPEGQWFVCLHVREGGFLPHNEHIQAHRNASIENAFLAIKEIINRGGFVVRMGDSSMKPVPAMPGLIDYAHHPKKSDRMDIALCARAKFFLGCTSGLAFVSMIFGVPVAQANMIPTETLGIRSGDISIPKLLFQQSQNRYLTFKEIFSSDIGGYFFTNQYRESGIFEHENTPEDILMLAQEMLDRLENKFVEDRNDRAIHNQYISYFKPGHYSYGAASQICSAFLRKYKQLL